MHYRVVGRGDPIGLARPVRNYTVVAFVSQEGVVMDLTATYTVSVDGRPASVRREWTYGRFDETTVDPPAWYERRSSGNATRATATSP